MQLKDEISYKVNLKHLLICLFIELIIIVITNLILFKIDKSYENKSSREPLYRDSLSHHRTSDVAYGGFAVMFTKS